MHGHTVCSLETLSNIILVNRVSPRGVLRTTLAFTSKEVRHHEATNNQVSTMSK